MTLTSLSHRARAALRSLLAIWARPQPEPLRIPPAVVEAQEAIADARRRKDSRGIHEAHQRARQARIEGLRAEILARRLKESMQ